MDKFICLIIYHFPQYFGKLCDEFIYYGEQHQLKQVIHSLTL